jgi:hypothetical protein
MEFKTGWDDTLRVFAGETLPEGVPALCLAVDFSKVREVLMSSHPEERRIAGLLRELIVQSGTPLEALERRLDWEPGRLSGLLEGHLRLTFEEVLDILPLLGTTPTDFFAWLYGFEAKVPVMMGASEDPAPEPAGFPPGQRAQDRRFEQSLRVVKDAVARRAAWKRERVQ